MAQKRHGVDQIIAMLRRRLKKLLTPARVMSYCRNRFLVGGSELLAVARVHLLRRGQ